MEGKKESLKNLFPVSLREPFKIIWERAEMIEEVRLRVSMPVCIYLQGEEYFLSNEGKLTRRTEEAFQLTDGQLDAVFKHICEYSPYAYMEELKQGFLTVAGGHRIGVAGQIQADDEKVESLKNARFLNIRISHEILGVADRVLPCIVRNKRFLSTLILSAPGAGKTTLLRDLIRQLSDGNDLVLPNKVGVVDERSEIAGCYQGIPQNHMGIRTDVLDACPKTRGMMMLIRSMSPQIVAIDELGGSEDIEALKKVVHCGCRVLVTIHGESLEELRQKEEMKLLLENQIFERFVVLKKEGGKRSCEIMDQKGGILCSG